MARPGVIFTESVAPGSRGAPTDTSTLFLIGLTASGTQNSPTLVRSIGDYTTAFGGRTGAGISTYDYLDVHFREGGSRAYVVKLTAATLAGATDALATLVRTLGPGRVAAVGDFTTDQAAVEALLAAHAEANNRLAWIQLAGDEASELTTEVGVLSALPEADRVVSFAGNVIVPGEGGTTRTVPLAAAQAGVEARRDRTGDVGVVAAFDDFPFNYVSDLALTLSDVEIEALVQAGVNLAKDAFGSLELFSYVTALEREDGTYWMLNAANIRMSLQAICERIGHSFLGKRIDGQGRSLGALEGALKGVLIRFWEQGNLFGSVPSEAFEVIADFGNNPASELAQGNVFASLNVRISPYAEFVRIDLVTTPITQPLAG